MLGGETFERDFPVWKERPENVCHFVNRKVQDGKEQIGVPVVSHPFFFDDNDKILVFKREGPERLSGLVYEPVAPFRLLYKIPDVEVLHRNPKDTQEVV